MSGTITQPLTQARTTLSTAFQVARTEGRNDLLVPIALLMADITAIEIRLEAEVEGAEVETPTKKTKTKTKVKG
jgi:hypothetical protein